MGLISRLTFYEILGIWKEKMSYDDVISLLGDFGRYQKKIYFLLCLPAILCAFHKLGNVFLIAESNSRCKLPYELSNSSYYINDTEWKKWFPYNKTSQKISSYCLINSSSTPGEPLQRCEEFIYDHTTYGYTAVTDWNLNCGKEYLIAISNSLFMFGVMFGSIGFGELSDRWGRKKTFFLSLVVQVVFGTIAAFAPEFWTFTIARSVVGATTSGVFLVAYVIGLEMVGSSMRMVAGTVCQIFFSFGYMLTAVFAIYINDWRTLQFALTMPGLIFLTYWWLIPESARWLVSKNRLEEAKMYIQAAAKCNKVDIPDKTLDQLLKPSENSSSKKESKPSIFNIFKYPNLRNRSLIIFFDWFANNITYYGLSWNTNNLGGDPYLNFVISGAVEIPAYIFLLLTLNKWGRKNVMSGCMIFAGTALLLTMIVPQNLQWLIVTLAMLGKLAITASYGAVYIFSTEQFPTVVRNAGLGAGSTCARVGSIITPYINITAHIWQPLPLLIFGALAFLGGLMSLILPETLNRKLPETFEEGEAFGKKEIHLTINSEELMKMNIEEENTKCDVTAADFKT
ncbi:organic cation transporter protein-like [Euwallacea similis]|uniref:organic cation transporter protein-like n=1 Tax=Euwallacea similis TaxID=1736056 RepID=UPI00344B5EF2